MDKTILQSFEFAVSKWPSKVAYREGEKQITYLELFDSARSCAMRIIEGSDGATRQPVCVMVDNYIDSIVGMLGSLYSGNYYVLIDASLPSERMAMMAGDLCPAAVVGCSKPEFLDSLDCSFVDLSDPNGAMADDLLLSSIRSSSKSFDPLCGVFTSGSTGKPKLIVKTHAAMIDFIDTFVGLFDFDHTDVFAGQMPLYFDASSKDVFVSMRVGATVEVIPKRFFSSPAYLVDFLCEKRATVLIWVPSALCILENALQSSCRLPESIRRVMFVGEQMPVKQLNGLLRKLPGAQFVNLYGSTEVAGNFLYHICKETIDETSRIPLGTSFPNVNVMLLDGDKEVCSTSDVGEICVAGNTLSLGYFGMPEKTKEVFVPNPLTRFGEIIYRTGDLAYRNEHGELVWLSRKDHQIKHMGYRIELSEIECVVNSLPDVKECCCVYKEKEKKIVLYYSSTSELRKEISQAVRSKLPKYMFPSKYIRIEQMPHNRNGKIDRALLNEM